MGTPKDSPLAYVLPGGGGVTGVPNERARARALRALAGGAAQCARAGLTDFANAAHDGHSLRGAVQ